MVQWLRIHLLIQRTWVWALVLENFTGCRATKPVCHNYWAPALEPACCNYRSLHPLEGAVLCNKRSHYNKKPATREYPPLAATGESPCAERRPSAAAAAAKSLQSCPTLCDPIDGSPPGSLVPGTLRDPMDCSLPGSSVHGNFQARVLEWDAIAFSERPSAAKNKKWEK